MQFLVAVFLLKAAWFAQAALLRSGRNDQLMKQSPDRKNMAMLENSVQQLLNSAGPDVAALAGSLNTVMEDEMKPTMRHAMLELQKELDGHYTSGYARCDEALAKDKGPDGKLSVKTSVFKKAQSQHQTCRKEESDAQTAHSACSTTESQLAAQKETACKVVSDFNKANSSDCTKQEGESEEAYTRRLHEYYEARNKKVREAEEKCDSATTSFENKVAECSGLKDTWSGIRAACGREQDTMDEASCDIQEDETAVCKEYSRCYEQATISYSEDLEAVKQQQADLAQEWTALLRMQCLLQVFAKDADKQTALATCKGQDHSKVAGTAMTLRFPTPVPKTAQLCSTLGGAAANSHYIVQHYGSLPQNAQAKTCSASCCTKCSEFLCPHGFVNIDQADQKIGSLKESCCVEGSLFPNSVLVNQKHQTLLRDWMQSSKRWTLCYQRSTDGGDSPAAFHAGCDNKGPTITVMKLSTGKVVGGYNANSWSSPVLGRYEGENKRAWDTYYSPNDDRTGFLFSLTTEFKHKQNDRRFLHYTQYATWNGDTMGPNFGLFHRGDLQAFSWEAGKTGDGYRRNKCDIGYTYITRVGQTTERYAREDFCGSFDNFGIEEMEVFYQS